MADAMDAKKPMMSSELTQASVPGRYSIARRGGLNQPYPLSSTQQRLWFLEQLEPGSPAYYVADAVRLVGQLEGSALQLALDGVVARHEALRTTFRQQGGEPVQMINEPREVELRTIDLSARPSAADEEIRGLLRREARRTFDLSHDLMLRATLVKLAAEDSILMLSAHHIASDGWSLGILRREIVEFYTAQVEQREPDLPELPIQYADYALWQREELASERLTRKLDYWKERLAGAPAVLDLPSDRPRPARQSYEGERQYFVIPAELQSRLKALAVSEKSTLYIVLLAAFQTLLHRYSGQTDICVGTPVAARIRRETESLVGFFANTIVLRGDLSGQPSFRDLVRSLRGVAFDAYDHQEVPFEKLVEILHPERSSSHEPLFQVMLVFQNTPDADFALPGVEVSRFEMDIGTAKFDLTMVVRERGSELRCALEYSTDLFDAGTASRMIGHFTTLLQNIVDAPDQPISSLGLLTAAERHQILIEWNDTARACTSRCVHELFEETARRVPESAAVVFEGRSLTYAELNRRADCLARYLRELDVKPGVLVGLYVERSLEMIVAVLGTHKAGGAYVPLDPAFPKERLAFMIEASGLGVLLTQAHLLDKLPARAGHVVVLDTLDWKRPLEHSDPVPVSQDDLAYVLYTSGSTGQPKGVAIEHAGLVNVLEALRRAFDYREQDRLLGVSTLSFDIAEVDIYMPLITGSTLTLATREAAADPQALAELIDSSNATFLQATPATWRMLVESGWRGKADLQVFSGGEKLPRPLAEQLLSRSRAVWNGYGPTETSIYTTLAKVEHGEDPVSLGRPLANTLAYVLDAQLQPLPVGIPGELYHGGAGLAREYLHRPDLTAERFFANPFGTGRLYKTGDLVRWRENGEIDFLRRLDDQIKLRGFRIELGEIEAVLSRHPSVKGACALIREDTPGEPYLAAYYMSDAAQDQAHEIRDFLRQYLPEYMVPSKYVAVERFPLTPNGKIDRRALPAPPAPAQVAAAELPEMTPMQHLVAEVWGGFLGVEGVSLEDNFYDLGGHSLLSMQVINELEERTGVRISLREMVFQSMGQVAGYYEHNAKAPIKPRPGKWMGRLSNAIQRVRSGKA